MIFTQPEKILGFQLNHRQTTFTKTILSMNKNIYKYVGPNNLNKLLSSTEHVSLKCSRPNEFNDPYELFLTVDFNERPEIIAFYSEVVGELPQLPTTCFSLSPAVPPMWAHYAQNLEGFVIEFDEEKLAREFPESSFGNVNYRDTPDTGLTDMLHRASAIGKGRHVYMLQQGVFNSAYCTKTTCWSYEKERRMIVQESKTRLSGEIILMDVPNECVNSFISGPRASMDTIAALRARAAELGCKYFQLKIGKSSASQFFINSIGDPFVFNGTSIVPSLQHCASCQEPLINKSRYCSWCQINETHMRDAAARNPYRMYARHGLLNSYIAAMDKISRMEKKK
ncbi:DUF2971 domain-containing protein [Rugamonas sp. DEMB1]|uniref:DUF2971 domain-containing protein n=1 Tax=Rugamonas sp. DEMB1 TaxID=3039386 RepID=UPI00244C90A9|nr:DUF2971 domain-containing protein [Rugamonas sp. DEMB1]WGG53275.1 DUF2971 domain-containing protein [Rugamonas sp. DEMB1]